MTKFFTTITFSLFWLTACFAQQEQQYTQFMYNKLGLNPGYAGIGGTCFTGIYRSQWIGLEGSPTAQTLSFSTPLGKRKVGLGLNLAHNTVGIENRINGDMSYSYLIPLKTGTLGLGVQASFRNRNLNFDDTRLKSTQDRATDPAILTGNQSKTVPNFGAGIFYDSETFYFGISIPRLIENNIDFSSSRTTLNKEFRQLYMMSGYAFKVDPRIKLVPQLLLMYVKNAPINIEMNVNAIFNDRFIIGSTYRVGGLTGGLGESVDFLLGAQLSNKLLFALTYDVSLSAVRNYNSGSIEAMLRYCLYNNSNDGKEYINPRFF